MVRPATIEDLFWLRLLFGDLIASLPEAYPRRFASHVETETALLASRLRSDPSFLCYVVEADKAIVGFIFGEVSTRNADPSPYLWLAFEYIVPAYRGRGLGRKMFSAIVAAGRERGCLSVEFEQQAGDTQWTRRGWPTVSTVHALRIDRVASTLVAQTKVV